MVCGFILKSHSPDVLDECGSTQEGVDIGHSGREVVGAWLGGGVTKSSSEEGDVLSLVLADLGDTVSDL